ncbi:MAG: IS630 transposase-related protein, partial [Planctomycetota bacterium]
MAYSTDLRQKALEAVARGVSVAEASRVFGISVSTVHDFRRYRKERGTLEPLKPGSIRHRKLTHDDLDLIRHRIDEDPGITLNAIRVQLSVDVAESTVRRAARKIKYTLKKSRSLTSSIVHGRRSNDRTSKMLLASWTPTSKMVFLD